MRKPASYQLLLVPKAAAITMIDVAVSAYRGGTGTEDEWLNGLSSLTRLVDIKPFQSSGLDAFAGTSPLGTFIGVRGTEGVRDVLSDLTATRVRAYKGKAHKGFYRDAKRLYEQLGLREYLATTDGPIYLSGHSMGAAICIELAGLMIRDGLKSRLSGVLALCAPRSSNASRSRWLSRMLRPILIRITFCRDIVVMLPLRMMGYRHVGDAHYFDRKEEYHLLLTTTYRVLDLIGALWADKGRWVRGVGDYHSAKRVAALSLGVINSGRLVLLSDEEGGIGL